MNYLERKLLLKFCREHGLDPHEIDDTLTYYENKKHLQSLVVDFNLEGDLAYWESAEEQYMAEHPLWNYLFCMATGKTKSKDVGEVSSEPQMFSLKAMAHVGFSLQHLVKLKNTLHLFLSCKCEVIKCPVEKMNRKPLSLKDFLLHSRLSKARSSTTTA